MIETNEPPAPSDAPRRPRASLLRQKRFLIVGVVVVAALAYLGFTAFQGASMYYLTVDELLAREDIGDGERVRLMGKVVDGSVEENQETHTLRFKVTSEAGTAMPVVYTGMVPDAFKQGADVVLEGSLADSGTFQADAVLVKCPSKYESETGEQAVEDGD